MGGPICIAGSRFAAALDFYPESVAKLGFESHNKADSRGGPNGNRFVPADEDSDRGQQVTRSGGMYCCAHRVCVCECPFSTVERSLDNIKRSIPIIIRPSFGSGWQRMSVYDVQCNH
jgi:hypothetical protein